MNKSIIRLANLEDAPAIAEIYNQAITQTFQTARTKRVSLEERTAWLTAHQQSNYPVYVYELEAKVVAWLSFSAHRPGREALSGLAEISYYVDQDFQRKGIGKALLSFAETAALDFGFHNLFAIILEKNVASIALLQKNGYQQWAYLPDVANFSGQLCSQVYLGKCMK